MNAHIEKKPGFKIAGIAVHDGSSSDFSGVWDQLFKKYTMEQLDALGSGEPFGSCYGYKSNDKFSYIAGYDLKNEALAEELGLDIVDVPDAEYAVLQIHGSIPDSIRKGWEFMYSHWLAEYGYTHAGTPDFEYYLDGDPNDPNYEMQLWVPVKRTSGD